MSATTSSTASAASRSRCVACDGAPGGVVLDATAPSGAPLALLRCTRCEHVYLDGWGAGFDADLYAYYDARARLPKEQVYQPLNAQRHRELLAGFAAHVEGRRLLDVGCGEGHLVDTASRDGWDAVGIDLAEGAIRVAQALGTACRVQDFFDPVLDGERFDVIAMSELIEHVPDPARFLRRARELLVPGGILYMTTPNFASLSRRVMGARWPAIHPEHLSYFTPRSLRRLAVKEADLEVVRLETRNFAPRAAAHLVSAAARLGRGRREPAARTKTDGDAAVGDRASRAGRPPSVAPVQRIRQLVERSAVLRGAKRGVNGALSAVSGGDTIFLTARR